MLYYVARFIMRMVLAVLRRWEVIGLQNAPQKDGFIIVSNHTSYWDPVAVGCAFNKPVHYMAKAELFKIPIFTSLIKGLKSFPVNRKKMDRSAIRYAIELLNDGQALGIFPEGTRSATGELQKAELGTAMLAFKSGVPVVPVGIHGAKGMLGKLKLVVGKPIPLPELKGAKPSRQDLEEYSKKIMNEISNLMKTVKTSQANNKEQVACK
ncbi:MAG: 1-acyl-sn-glycerol-3-phosphate acyltransferase [Firmicutes bacterium]|nr:1-acyl-sn-glycerol-3-phosphate acyltransferase [Bacillota bacterium]